jgi:hypothetical protein
MSIDCPPRITFNSGKEALQWALGMLLINGVIVGAIIYHEAVMNAWREALSHAFD